MSDNIRDKNAVKEQYADSENLDIRIAIHQKYSINKQGFGNWIFQQYEFFDGCKILELGCGNGSMWRENIKLLPKNCRLILSDFSEKMLATTRENVPVESGIGFEIIDIQNIPFEDNSFDIVIANMMLYHVPDLSKALGEVRRVLKDGGKFYCATYGESGVIEYLEKLFADIVGEEKRDKIFTLQNGGEILSKYFSCVERRNYEDGLEVTDVNDLADYIYSVGNMSKLGNLPRELIIERLTATTKNGIIRIPKEYGMFISNKGSDQ